MTARRLALPSLNLAQQGVILVVSLLFCEFLFIGTLSAMMAQAENEAQRQDYAREINAKASRLLLVVYDTGDAVGKFTLNRQLGTMDRYKAGSEEIPVMIDWLKTNLKGKAEAEQLIARIEANLAICTPVIDGIKRDAQHMSKEESLQIWRERRMPIQPQVDALVADLEGLMSYARAIEDEAPVKQRSQRDATRWVLLGGLLANVLFFIVMVKFFTKTITKRLDVIGDNVARMERGAELNAPLGGTDEIAEVDRVFHATAEAVRREEALLKQSEERLRNILESVPIGVVVVQGSGVIEFANPEIERSFGYATGELLGQNLSTLLPPSANEKAGDAPGNAADALRNLIGSASRHTTELTATRKDRSQFPADFSAADIVLGNDKKHIAMIVDASEREEIRKLRSSFVNMIREELRVPLTRIDNFFVSYQAGRFGEVSDEASKGTKKAKQNIDRLLLLLNDLFDLEKLESGKIEVVQKMCSLDDIINRAKSDVSGFATKNSVQLATVVEDDAHDLQVYADPERIIQVLVNLLSNAVKFSPAESLVSLVVSRRDNEVQVSVIDKGRGIPADRINSLFQQFQQVEAADGAEKGGTGLGLAICKAIIEEHGSTITVESEAGRGSEFKFSLPLNIPVEAGSNR